MGKRVRFFLVNMNYTTMKIDSVNVQRRLNILNLIEKELENFRNYAKDVSEKPASNSRVFKMQKISKILKKSQMKLRKIMRKNNY